MKSLLLKNELRSQTIPKFRIYCALRPSLQFLVSCFTNNKGLSTLPVKYNKAIFAVINPHGHDKSKHAKRLTPQLPDT